MEQTTPKGATMLKVTGILMIIGGAISIIVSILAIIGIAAIAYLSDGSASLGLLYASGALLTVSSVAELIAGILGTANCKKPEKAKTCLAWGIVVAVLAVAGIILNAIGGGQLQRNLSHHGPRSPGSVHHRRCAEQAVSCVKQSAGPAG